MFITNANANGIITSNGMKMIYLEPLNISQAILQVVQSEEALTYNISLKNLQKRTYWMLFAYDSDIGSYIHLLEYDREEIGPYSGGYINNWIIPTRRTIEWTTSDTIGGPGGFLICNINEDKISFSIFEKISNKTKSNIKVNSPYWLKENVTLNYRFESGLDSSDFYFKNYIIKHIEGNIVTLEIKSDAWG